MDWEEKSQVLLTFVNFLTLGVVYQEKFQSRKDWIPLDSLFYETEVSSFLKKALCFENSVGYYHDRIKIKSTFNHLLDFRPATGRESIKRKVCERRISYPSLCEANLQSLFFYHYSLDYVDLPGLPARLRRLLQPFSPYYKLTSFSYEFDERSSQIDVLRNVSVVTATGKKVTLTATFEHATDSELERFRLESQHLRLSVDLKEKLINYQDQQRGKITEINYAKDFRSVLSLVM